MATYVLIHGAWAGGWCWKPIRHRLAASGGDVFTPTLTGLGERAHLAGPDVGVDTHVRDVVATLEMEDLRDVTLVAHSYAGSVATALADEAAGRLARLIYVDAFVPSDGDATFDFFPAELREAMRAAAHEHGDGWRIPAGAELLDLWSITDPAQRAWVGARLTAFPLRCFEQTVKLSTNAAADLPRTYIAATAGPTSAVFAPFAERARHDGWPVHELATGHAAWVTTPGDLADLILASSTEN